MKFNPGKKKYYIRFISSLTIVIASLFCSTIIIYQSIISSVTTSRTETMNTITDVNYEKLKIVFLSLESQAKFSTRKVAENIKREINILYSSPEELHKLEQSLDKNNLYDKKFLDMLKSQIDNQYLGNVENFNNDMHIADFNGIITDYSYNSTVDGRITRTWEEEEINQYNKKLYKNSLEKLLNQEKGIIVVERRMDYYNSDNYTKYENFTTDTLMDVYDKEGLEGFKRYTFIIPTYVYDHTDIFGNDDVISGTKINNHKLIVIQEFNLYDQITSNYESLFMEDSIPVLNNSYDEILSLLYGLGLVLVITVIGLIFFLATLYNWIMIFLRNNTENNEEETDEMAGN